MWFCQHKGNFIDISNTSCVIFGLEVALNIALVFFWTFGVTKKALESAAKVYAKALLASIDTIGSDVASDN